jgi:hypothetical protein
VTDCPATAPDNWQVRCELAHGHAGAHRSNMVIWNDPEPVDLSDSEAWVGGQVLLAHEREPELGP